MRAVKYVRYSSSNQREASNVDQALVCDRYIAANGWQNVGQYADAAISGANAHRPDYLRLLSDAKAGRFDVVVSEHLDRIGRNLAEIASFYEKLTFHGVQIHTLRFGHVTPMHVAMLGTMAEMQLSDMRDKVRRGQLGRVRLGRTPGGLAYGYEVVPPAPGAKESGERRIKPDEAAVVRRIFEDFADAISPRQLASNLNAEGISGPNGRPWIDTTIRGQVERATGILNNTLYIGLLTWDRCSYVKDPSTGRRVARPNPPSKWEVTEVPELRIIHQELWDAVKVRQAAVRIEMSKGEDGNALNGAHRRQFLLSGLLTCGVCGGAYTIIGKDRYGCAVRRGKGTCSNGKAISRQRVEARVLGALKERMLTPSNVEAFIRSYAEELAVLQRDSTTKRSALEHRLAGVERSLGGILHAIESGSWSDTLRTRLTELEKQKAALVAERTALMDLPPVQLHPKAAELYAAKVAELETSLNAPDIRPAAMEILRGLIDRITLTPDLSAPDGLAAELHGDLGMILSLAASAASDGVGRRGPQNTKLPRTVVLGSQFSVVAGRGFEPLTFRL